MANPIIFPTGLQWMGMGKEGASTYGTPAAAPTVWVPVVSPKHAPQQTMLKDQALRGSMGNLYGQVAGVRYDTLDYQTFLYLDSAMPHMMNILGGPDAITGGADPYTHKTSLLNNANAGQPTSWTIWLFNGSECWRMAGCQLAGLDIETKVLDSLAGLTPSWMGLPATIVTAPSNTPTTKLAQPAWNTTLTIGGTGTTNYSDIKLSMKRATSAEFGANGTQSPYVIFVGELTVTGSLLAIYRGNTVPVDDMSGYLANTQPALVLQNNPAGDAVHYAKFQHSQMAYDNVSIADNGKYLEVTANLEAVDNATDATNGGVSPQLFSLLSPVSAAY
jgi:hypothetical protein